MTKRMTTYRCFRFSFPPASHLLQTTHSRDSASGNTHSRHSAAADTAAKPSSPLGDFLSVSDEARDSFPHSTVHDSDADNDLPSEDDTAHEISLPTPSAAQLLVTFAASNRRQTLRSATAAARARRS